MKLYFPYLLPGEEPITSVAEYFEVRGQYDALERRIRSLLVAIKDQEDAGQKPAPKLFEELNAVRPRADQAMYEFFRRLPHVLVSRCPYCEKPIWLKADVFSLIDEFWYRKADSGRDGVFDEGESPCPHLFCVDGALNLDGHQPTEVRNRIVMAAEVPFVKPRVLKLPTMVAVIHSFPIAERYTAYPIVYFAERQPDQLDFCIPWAKTEFEERHKPSGGVFTGKRSDVQDYNLMKWVRQRRLFWLDLNEEEEPLVRGPASAFPYREVPGRRHPYYIEKGRVCNLPNPVESKPTYYLEDPFGPRLVVP